LLINDLGLKNAQNTVIGSTL